MYSRENEDEVIASLLDQIGEGSKIVVDIGAKSIENSNVMRLVLEEGWRACLFEKGVKNTANLWNQTEGMNVFVHRVKVTPNNVNEVMPSGAQVLSIDIDGQDYYVWEAMQDKAPIVVIEYNPRRVGGIEDKMPRDDKYAWKKLREWNYYGASKAALVALGESRGYKLVETNENNLFFLWDGATK